MDDRLEQSEKAELPKFVKFSGSVMAVKPVQP